MRWEMYEVGETGWRRQGEKGKEGREIVTLRWLATADDFISHLTHHVAEARDPTAVSTATDAFKCSATTS
jgi:hypothetical protein